MTRIAVSATGKNGEKIIVGDFVLHLGYDDTRAAENSAVRVVSIHRQGADGTILTTNPAPDVQYPHHFGCRASQCVKVKKYDTL